VYVPSFHIKNVLASITSITCHDQRELITSALAFIHVDVHSSNLIQSNTTKPCAVCVTLKDEESDSILPVNTGLLNVLLLNTQPSIVVVAS